MLYEVTYSGFGSKATNIITEQGLKMMEKSKDITIHEIKIINNEK